MINAWIRSQCFVTIFIAPSTPVYHGSRKATVSTVDAGTEGVILLTTARSGSVSLCFKYHKAQTVGHLAPGCEDELSGLDPANRAAFSFNEGHTETKGYSGGIGLCQLHEDPTIKPPTGRDTLHESQSINYVKEPRRTASHARSSRKLAVDIVISMGGINDAVSNL